MPEANTNPPITRKTTLSENIIAFCRFLREKGFRIGPDEEADALRAIELMQPFHSRETLQMTLKCILARTYGQLEQFEELYRQYWKELEKAVDAKVMDKEEEASKKEKTRPQPDQVQKIKDWLQGRQPEDEMEAAAYSAGESQLQKDFSAFSDEELWEILRLIQRLARSMARRYSRRQEHARRTGRMDLRRTLRKNLRRGGEILDLAFEKPRRERQRIVLICDVSKSMDLYSQFLIQFIYAFQSTYKKIETFVFSTSLQRVTHRLQQRDYSKALEELSTHVPGWSGGTKIGASLHTFVEDYASRLLNRHTTVLIMSDGWDTGDTEILAASMRRIQQKSNRVIWLNPMAGNPDYRPAVKGMQAAWPFIDMFAPAHNVESLRRVAGMLK